MNKLPLNASDVTDKTEPAKQFLEDAVFLFEARARRSVECVLGASTRVARAFSVAPVLVNTFSVSGIIQAGNPDFVAAVISGANAPDLDELIPSVDDMDMRLDAIGEITHVLAGNLLSHPYCLSRLGVMSPSLPVFVHGGTTIRKSWCIQGTLLVNSVKLFIGFAVERTAK